MFTNISISIIKEITKFRLTISVVFSSFISYLLGAAEVNYIQLFYLISGGILIVSSSNIFNQIIERDLDKLMKRTQNRPLPKNEITPKIALFLAIASCVVGLIFMYLINIKVAILAAISIFLYTSIYTPMKLISPLAVFIGACQNCITRATKYTIYDATKELAFLPLDTKTKRLAKTTIDGVGSRIGKSSSSLLYQVLFQFISIVESIPYILIICVATLLAWIKAIVVVSKKIPKNTR